MRMKTPSKWIIGLAMLAAGSLSAGSAFAQWHHHHGGPRVSIGFGFGPYWGGPGYWGPPWYYPPPPVYYPAPVFVSPPPPTQYVEREDQPHQQGYWYYCETSRGYYPYVKECPSGWRAVPPAPEPAR